MTPEPGRPRNRAPGRLGYRPGLDGVRAVAIGLVVLCHTQFFLVPAWRNRFFAGGFLGVCLFFVLSGFLITTLLLERHGREHHPIGVFYARRALRLVPAMLVLLIANLVFAAVESKGVADALRAFPVSLSYMTNWAEVHGVRFSGRTAHLWTLAVEGQFYLVWPILLFGALRLGLSRRWLFHLVLAGVVAAALWRLVRWSSTPSWFSFYFRTDTYVDALLVGAALALLPYDRLAGQLSRRVRTALGLGALAVIVVAAGRVTPASEVLYQGGFVVIAVASAVVILAALRPGSGFYALLSTPPAVALGRISYSLYLWHLPVFLVLSRHTQSWTPWTRVLVAWPLAGAAATASYRFVEQPALRLKRRLGSRRARPRRMESRHAAARA